MDLVYYGQQGQLECDWRVAPGADPQRIQLAVQGALRLEAQGTLLLQTPAGTLEQQRPVVYQQVGGARAAIRARYVRTRPAQLGVAPGTHDHSNQNSVSYGTGAGGPVVPSATPRVGVERQACSTATAW